MIIDLNFLQKQRISDFLQGKEESYYTEIILEDISNNEIILKKLNEGTEPFEIPPSSNIYTPEFQAKMLMIKGETKDPFNYYRVMTYLKGGCVLFSSCKGTPNACGITFTYDKKRL